MSIQRYGHQIDVEMMLYLRDGILFKWYVQMMSIQRYGRQMDVKTLCLHDKTIQLKYITGNTFKWRLFNVMDVIAMKRKVITVDSLLFKPALIRFGYSTEIAFPLDLLTQFRKKQSWLFSSSSYVNFIRTDFYSLWG